MAKENGLERVGKPVAVRIDARRDRVRLENHSAFADVGTRVGATPQQVAIAWLLGMSERVIPIPGASRPESVRSSAEAVDLVLSDADRAALDDA